MLSALIYSRIINPYPKYKTYFDVIPYLDKEYSFSYDQLLEGLGYFGENYEKVVEVFTKFIKEKYKVKTDVSYFDCTYFYFEIDLEDEDRMKGKSKENNTGPLIGMGYYLTLIKYQLV